MGVCVSCSTALLYCLLVLVLDTPNVFDVFVYSLVHLHLFGECLMFVYCINKIHTKDSHRSN